MVDRCKALASCVQVQGAAHGGKMPHLGATESVCAQAGLTLGVLPGTEAKPELQVVGHRPASVCGAVGGVRRGEGCRQELVPRECVKCVMCENEYVYVCAFANMCTDRLLDSTAAASPLGLLSDSPSHALRPPQLSSSAITERRTLHSQVRAPLQPRIRRVLCTTSRLRATRPAHIGLRL